ncbi:FAD-dependent thiol oxidase [Dentipellis sp. KUC8613]|nr:FAD-dependent thiol oxidase [Dentipellis sp. KUC8613]
MSKEKSTPAGNNAPLPPGMVLGPDGKPCKICTAFRHWTPAPASASTTSRAAGAASLSAAALGTAAATEPPARPADCPPDVEQLGRATWTFLHTTAAYYPEKPTTRQRANMLSLLHALPVLYPCSHCATHLGAEMERHPPDVSSRKGLSWWLCERHNEVNERLGKERFDCAKTDERWKDGPKDGSCD